MTEASGLEAQLRAQAGAEHCARCGATEARLRFRTTDLLYRTTRREFGIAECSQCGLLRLYPRPSPAELSAYYPPSYWFDPAESAAGRLEEAYRRIVLCDHLHFVTRALRDAGEGGRVLDVGCGGGLFLGLLGRRGYHVLGLDLSPEAAGIAWIRQGVPMVVGELSNCPVAASTCAAVTMFHVLEHVADPRKHLDEAARLLRPGGRLIVQVPNADCWQFNMLGRRWNGVDAPRHLHLFRAGDVERILEASGLRVLRRKYFSLRDNPAGLATSLAPSLDPMARRIRGKPESAMVRLTKDLLYFVLVAAALPFAALEAAFRNGSTVMIEACRMHEL